MMCNQRSLLKRQVTALLFLFCGILLSFEPCAANEARSKPSGDSAWNETRVALRQVDAPSEWRQRPPTEGELAQYRMLQQQASEGAIDTAKQFYTKFPDHPRAKDAKARALILLKMSVASGNQKREADLATLEASILSDQSFSEDERFEIWMEVFQRNLPGYDENTAKQQLKLVCQQYSGKPQLYNVLLELAGSSTATKAQLIGLQILDSPDVPEESRNRAKALIKAAGLFGKKLDAEISLSDGSSVKFADLEGRVVLLHFWSSENGASLAQLPNLKQLYGKFKAKGLEIIGISLDERETSLLSGVSTNAIKWPQHWAGKTGDTSLAQQFGIQRLPTLWLIDKKGVLRKAVQTQVLEEEVSKLLSEP